MSERAPEPVEIARAQYDHEARMIAGLLEDAGIDAFVMTDDVGGMYPGIFGGVMAARVFVRAEDAEAAREVLADLDEGTSEVDRE